MNFDQWWARIVPNLARKPTDGSDAHKSWLREIDRRRKLEK